MGQTIDPRKPACLITPRILLMHTARVTVASLVLLGAQAIAIDIQQSGTSNTASAEQVSLIYAEKSTIDQIGDSNDAVLFQQGTGASEQMLVTHITQTGDLNAAAVTQRALQGQIVIQQTGTQNQANVEQAEIASGLVEILQTGSNNLAELAQFLVEDRSSPQASIVQEGSDNIAMATQRMYTEDSLAITQVGTGNIAHVQHGDGSSSSLNRDSDIFIEMIGDANEAYIVQSRAYSGSLADVSYTGSGNVLNLEQFGETSKTRIQSVNSDYNQDTIYQSSGGWQEILIERENTHNSRVTIDQNGMYFDAHARQIGSDGAVAEFELEDSFVGQALSEIIQTNVVNSLARIEQGGLGSGLIIQEGVDESFALIQMLSGENPSMNVVQMGGTGNHGEIDMIGVLLEHALIDQLGSFNHAQITHNSHLSGLAPTGMTASITQIGDYNQAAIAQSY